MKFLSFERKKLFRSIGFVYLCAALLALNFVFCLFGELKTPENDTYIANYEDNIAYVIRVAERNLLEYEAISGGEHYMTRYQRDVIERYSELLESSYRPESVRGWNEFFDNITDDLLPLLAAMLAGILISMAESDSGAEKILYMSARGRRSISAKIAILAIFAFAYTLLMTCSSLAGVALRFGLSSPSAALCSVEAFAYCPYPLTVGAYFAVSVLIKSASAFLLALSAALVSALARSCLLPVVFSLGSLGAGYWLTSERSERAARLLNIYSAALTDPFFERYRSLDLFGFSVPLIAVAAMILIALCAVAAILYYIFFFGSSSASRIAAGEKAIVGLMRKFVSRISAKLPRLKARRHGLLFTEAKKSFFKSYLILLCALMICVKIGYCRENAVENNAFEEHYRAACFELDGELTDEKRETIKTALAESSAVISRADGMRRAVVSGTITNEEYLAYLDDYSVAMLNRETYTRLSSQCDRIDNAAALGQTAMIVYDTGWSSLFGEGLDFILYVFLLLFFCGIYEAEYKSGFYRIAEMSAGGMRAVHKAKMALAAIVGACAFILFSGIDLFFLVRAYPLPNASYPLASVTETLSPINLGTAAVLKFAAGALIGVVFSLSVCLLSRFLKKTYLVIPAVLPIIVFMML